jgi:transcriptional regulator with XRE-family HTH domain
MISKTLGQIIEERRKNLRITQVELASKANTSQGYISDLENGKISNPTIGTILKIATILNLESSKLLVGLDNSAEEITIYGDHNKIIDFDVLDDEGKRQIIAFYEFIKSKYANKTAK